MCPCRLFIIYPRNIPRDPVHQPPKLHGQIFSDEIIDGATNKELWIEEVKTIKKLI